MAGTARVFLVDDNIVITDATNIPRAQIGLDFAGFQLQLTDGLNTYIMYAHEDHTVNFYDEDGDATLNMQPDSTTTFQMKAGKEFSVFLNAAATFTVYNHLGNPILRMTEGSPDLHIQTGGNLVADL